jgi:hypothetical protein
MATTGTNWPMVLPVEDGGYLFLAPVASVASGGSKIIVSLTPFPRRASNLASYRASYGRELMAESLDLAAISSLSVIMVVSKSSQCH